MSHVTSAVINSSSLLCVRKLPLFVPLLSPLYVALIYLLSSGYLTDHPHLVPVSIGTVLTITAITWLSGFWSVTIRSYLYYRHVNKFTNETSHILIHPKAHNGSSGIAQIIHDKHCSWFEFQKKIFIFDTDKKTFKSVPLPLHYTVGEYKSWEGVKDVDEQREWHGMNSLEIHQPTFVELFGEHAVAPFFVFQVFCVVLWMFDEVKIVVVYLILGNNSLIFPPQYWYYSLFTLFMLVVFESTVVFQRLSMLKEFRTMSNKPVNIQCQRMGQWMNISSDQLLPGDIVSLNLSDENVCPADVLILQAILSGESTPLLKEPLSERKDNEDFDLERDKRNVVFSGTKLVQVTWEGKSATLDNGALGIVLRTGFRTSQGKLVRTMIFNSERVTANNLESFLFILFLLIFAIMAAYYVWVKGVEKDAKSKPRLILEVIMIITAVVPPELPMELSLAVNNSLLALSKVAIYCTEPFRIPFAGKIDICCFDKTGSENGIAFNYSLDIIIGTLTSESLLLEGISGVSKDHNAITKPSKAPKETIQVMASCHGLTMINDEWVGDPMEKATVESIGFKMIRNDTLRNDDDKTIIRIIKRYTFTSALKRMSCLVSIDELLYLTMKGAPEIVKALMVNPPKWYDEVYKMHAKQGSRVLALGYRRVNGKEKELKEISRTEAEVGFTFCGFLIFQCPLKKDSAQAIHNLANSSHKVVMITGDNHLTACHVAKQVGMSQRGIYSLYNNSWTRIEDDHVTSDVDELKDHDLCITGESLDYFLQNYHELLPRVAVYARLKEMGLITLMVGDGTNDVGGLKQAHIGVALLNGTQEDLDKIANARKRQMMQKRIKDLEAMEQTMRSQGQRFGMAPDKIEQMAVQNRKRIEQQVQQMESMGLMEDEQVPMIKLGDASVAAPFTSKLGSVMSVCHIVRQGRCTLVTTNQMYRILALNCLITAYCMCVMNVDGLRSSDFQATFSSMLLAGSFLFLSQAQPLEKLCSTRPQERIFSWYNMLSILGQFAIHFYCLLMVVMGAKNIMGEIEYDLDRKFEPNLLNSAVYLLSLSMQVCTFAVNYQGHPFREGLLENKKLRNSLLLAGGVAFCTAAEIVPEFNAWLEIVPFEDGFRRSLVSLMALDMIGCFVCDRFLFWMLADRRINPLLK